MENVIHRSSPVHFFTMFDSSFDKSIAQNIIRSLAKLHAHYWNRPPKTIWRHNKYTGNPEGNTPMFYRLFASYGIQRVQSKLQGKVIFPVTVMKACDLVITHYPIFRKYWSKGPLTCCHGDAHLGNVFVDMNTKEVGLVDFQCVAQEHGMRDISYFLVHSYHSEDLIAHEEDLIRFYLEELSRNLKAMDEAGIKVDLFSIPTFKEAMFLYRSQAIWALFTWVICCCFAKGEKLELARDALQRVLNTCERLRVLEALEDVLAHY
jgi:thiamine kinase-like enzyme